MSDSNNDLKARMLAQNIQPVQPLKALSDPVSDTPMTVTLEQLRAYEHNPRTNRNPLYDQIKESIRERGLDAPPAITRRPGEEHFIIRNGGNTRLSILRELYQETGDQKYFRIHCMFRPWPSDRGEIIALTGHLAENELHGQLTFIERAIGVQKALAFYQQEDGPGSKSISQRELARRLTADGFPISNSHISRMQDAVRYLLPAIPELLYNGMGVDRAVQLLKLRSELQNIWDSSDNARHLPDFEGLFIDVLSQVGGDPEFVFDRFRDELTHVVGEQLGIGQSGVELLLHKIGQIEAINSTLPPVDSTPGPQAKGGIAQGPKAGPAHLPEPRSVPSVGGSSTPAPVETVSIPRPSESPVQHPDLHQPPPVESMTEAERAERREGHIIRTGLDQTPKTHQIRQMVAKTTGEPIPDFEDAVLTAIPIQVGGLHPIADLWYIEDSINAVEPLIRQIKGLGEEVLLSTGLPTSALTQKANFGWCVDHQAIEQLGESAQWVKPLAILMESLTYCFKYSLDRLAVQPDAGQAQTLSQLEWTERLYEQSAYLGSALIGLPGNPTMTRLGDAALVRLFRMIRLLRQLTDLLNVPERG